MTLRESESSRSTKPAKRERQKRKPCARQPLPPLPPVLNDNQCLTFGQWCQLGNFSKRTGRRILASGTGPVVTQLSLHRIGITVANDRAWKASRERA